jgi:hypothetical protein
MKQVLPLKNLRSNQTWGRVAKPCPGLWWTNKLETWSTAGVIVFVWKKGIELRIPAPGATNEIEAVRSNDRDGLLILSHRNRNQILPDIFSLGSSAGRVFCHLSALCGYIPLQRKSGRPALDARIRSCILCCRMNIVLLLSRRPRLVCPNRIAYHTVCRHPSCSYLTDSGTITTRVRISISAWQPLLSTFSTIHGCL